MTDFVELDPKREIEFPLTEIGAMPAFYANIFNVAGSPYFIRLTFGEVGLESVGRARTAVIMPHLDAKKLAMTILETVKRLEEIEKEQKAKK